MSIMEMIKSAAHAVMAWGDSYVVEPEEYKRDRIPVDAPTDEEVQKSQERFSNLVGAGLLAYTIGLTFLACYDEDWIQPLFWTLVVLGTGCFVAAHRIQSRSNW